MTLHIPPEIVMLFSPLELAIHKARFIRRLEIVGKLQTKNPDANPGSNITTGNDKDTKTAG